MPNLTVTVDELRRLGQTDLGWSAWLPVEQARVDLFADATEDHQWIHVDPDRAARGPFGTTIAHGYLTLSLIPFLLEDLLTVSDQVRGTNYGIDWARFTSPVRVGSRVRMKGQLLSVQERPDSGLQYRVGVKVHIDGQERPALIGELVSLAYGA